MKNAMQLKAKVKNFAIEHNLHPQVVLQTYMLEHLLMRIANSKYQDIFIIKGGMLIASMIGTGNRSTMDLDATLKGLELEKRRLEEVINDIIEITVDDSVTYKLGRVTQIRPDDMYGGFRVSLTAKFDRLEVPLKIDVTTGDVITPNEINMSYKPLFSSDEIKIKAHNLETVLAEKLETILSRSTETTRIRDYYDVYILHQKYNVEINYELLKKSLKATTEHRNSKALDNIKETTWHIENSMGLQQLWRNYQKEFQYASGIDWHDMINSLASVLERIR